MEMLFLGLILSERFFLPPWSRIRPFPKTGCGEGWEEFSDAGKDSQMGGKAILLYQHALEFWTSFSFLLLFAHKIILSNPECPALEVDAPDNIEEYMEETLQIPWIQEAPKKCSAAYSERQDSKKKGYIKQIKEIWAQSLEWEIKT